MNNLKEGMLYSMRRVIAYVVCICLHPAGDVRGDAVHWEDRDGDDKDKSMFRLSLLGCNKITQNIVPDRVMKNLEKQFGWMQGMCFIVSTFWYILYDFL